MNEQEERAALIALGEAHARELLGPKIAERIDGVREVDPEFYAHYMEFVLAGMYRREVLDHKTRELCAVAAATLLMAPDQITSHLRAALRSGASPEESREAITQMVVYGGFPPVLAALKTWKQVMEDEGIALPPSPSPGPAPTPEQIAEVAKQRTEPAVYEPSMRRARWLFGDEFAERVTRQLNAWDPGYAWLFQRFVYGGMYDRSVLSQRVRQLLTVAACTVQNAMPQLDLHIRAALRAGATLADVKEVILQMSVYVGMPYMLQAMRHLETMQNLPPPNPDAG